MDFNKLTVRSQEAIAAAQELARRMGNPELYPEHLLLALLDQELPSQLVPSASTLRAETEQRLAERPRISGSQQQPAISRALTRRAGPGGGRGEEARGRVRHGRAPVARAGRRPAGRAAGEDQGGAWRPAGDVSGSGGHLPGALEVRPRPDRGGRAGQARPRRRARRGDQARDPGALAAHEEQPGADRRARRRQDGDRRRARPANRRR